jgi:hypothetical protein
VWGSYEGFEEYWTDKKRLEDLKAKVAEAEVNLTPFSCGTFTNLKPGIYLLEHFWRKFAYSFL